MSNDEDKTTKTKAKKSKAPYVSPVKNHPRRCDGGAMNWNGDCLACDAPKGGKCQAPVAKKRPKPPTKGKS